MSDEFDFSEEKEKYRLWDPDNHLIKNFFLAFPIRNRHDSEIFECDRDILAFTLKHFNKKSNQDFFTEAYVMKRTANRYFDLEYVDKVEIPHYFFKGYFHPMLGAYCLESVRIGNPKDPMYKYSNETPSTRSYSIREAFDRGAMPCPKCFLTELLQLYQGDSENFE